ncbi:MOSC domain-containing protein [Halovulum sp. GXIMD14794]
MPRLVSIERHPIKAIGREEIGRVTLTADQTLPGDRLWAVEHEASRYDPSDGWGRCINFVRGASSAQLMAVRAETLADGRIRLSHPSRPVLEVDPDIPEDAARLIDWVTPICDPDRAQPVRVARAGAQGMTDNRNPWLSILSTGSLAALSEVAGTELEQARFRANLWIDGLAPWQEFDLVGKRLTIGAVEFEIAERIERCQATSVDTATGVRTVDTLKLLQENWGHRDFGVFARVVNGGEIATGDEVTLP